MRVYLGTFDLSTKPRSLKFLGSKSFEPVYMREETGIRLGP
jgi:hypothetical protein